MEAMIIEDGIVKKYIPDQKNACITIDENVIGIESRAFAGTDIKSVTLPKSITYLGMSAFSNCKELERVVFSDGLEKVEI